MTARPIMISVIIPTLNEAASIETVLASVRESLQTLTNDGAVTSDTPGAKVFEVIVVDGGSTDKTCALAQGLADCLIQAPRGRARQMNAGAARARGEYLLFLHADTCLPGDAGAQLNAAIGVKTAWGRFDVRIEGESAMLGVIAKLMNWRSRLTGIATGDQAMFVQRDMFERVSGFADQPLMEDIELSRQLLAFAQPMCLPGPARTSGRRWEARGVWPTILLMWRLRWRYWRGASAEELAKAYR